VANIRKKLGMRILQLRTEANLTQTQLAEKAELSTDSISRIERGQRAPSIESLEKIAKALKTQVRELFNFDQKEFHILAECDPEVYNLWVLLKDKKAKDVKKLYEIAKIII